MRGQFVQSLFNLNAPEKIDGSLVAHEAWAGQSVSPGVRQHVHAHTPTHIHKRTAVTGRQQRIIHKNTPPPGSVSLSICDTHTHSQWGSMWRFITQQCRQCAVAATVHSLPRRLLRPCPSFGGCWERILPLKQKPFALREVWWVNAKVWVSLRTVQRAYS